MTVIQATISIAQLVFFNTTPKTPNANRTEVPLPVYSVYWTLRSFKVKEWQNGGCVCRTWVVCELTPCHVGLYLEKKMGLFVMQQFTDEDFVGEYSPLEIPTI